MYNLFKTINFEVLIILNKPGGRKNICYRMVDIEKLSGEHNLQIDY